MSSNCSSGKNKKRSWLWALSFNPRALIRPFLGPHILILTLIALFFSLLSFGRFIDRDEGFYLYSAELIYSGMLPYRDFFFPQAPLMPYLLAGWCSLFGFDWYSARLFSAGCSAAIAVLIYYFLVQGRRKGFAYTGLLLFVTSHDSLLWFPSLKTYSLSSCLLLAAILLLLNPRTTSSRYRWLLSGILLGLLINTRLYFLLIAPFFLLHALLQKMPARLLSICFFLTGVSLASIPTAILFAISPDNFVFGNISFHALRTPYGLVGNLEQKKWILLSALGTKSEWFNLEAKQTLTLLVVALSVFLLPARKIRRLSLLYLVIPVLFIACILPTHAYVQYFSVVSPLLICAALKPLSLIRVSKPKLYTEWLLVGTVALILATFLSPFPRLLEKYFMKGGETPFRISTAAAVSEHISRLSTPDDVVLSFWAGYLVGSRKNSVRGFENHCPLNEGIAYKLDEKQRRAYLIGGEEELLQSVKDNPSTLLLTGHGPLPCPRPFFKLARSEHCSHLADVDGISFFRCRQK